MIDTSYDGLDAMARSPRPVAVRPLGEGIDEPALSARLPEALVTRAGTPQAADVAGRDVWLIHPWALGELPADLPAGCLRVGWWPAEHHAAWPWSAARRAFVGARLAALAHLQWHGRCAQLAQALVTARSVQTLADGHIRGLLPPRVAQHVPLRRFPPVDRPCASFSTSWKRSTRGMLQLSDLPGLAAQLAHGATRPLVDQAIGTHPNRSGNECP